LPGGWTDESAAVSFRGSGLRHGCSAGASPRGGRPSQDWRASQSAPTGVAASWVAAPSSPFQRPRGVPSIGLPRRPRAIRRLPQASPPSQGSGRDILTGPAGPGRPSWSLAPLQRRRPKRSTSHGFASPVTFRPRSFSLPRRSSLASVSRTRDVRCRSWGFDSESSFEREDRGTFPHPLRSLQSGAYRSPALASKTSPRRTLEDARSRTPWSLGLGPRTPGASLRSPSFPSRGAGSCSHRPLSRFPPRRLGGP